ALERRKPFGSSLWTLNTLVYLQLIIQDLLAPWYIWQIFFLIHFLNGFYTTVGWHLHTRSVSRTGLC
ncbi:MAG: hypothetical protein ACK55Z_19690, partial [bacterium]